MKLDLIARSRQLAAASIWQRKGLRSHPASGAARFRSFNGGTERSHDRGGRAATVSLRPALQ